MLYREHLLVADEEGYVIFRLYGQTSYLHDKVSVDHSILVTFDRAEKFRSAAFRS